ncbi:hypothetical protein ABZX30_02450 [Streptomyces sp. NPDC004542]|uniref:hypothetical protein n=1 Tax=Streptomyces sp. NPDC004542 TaxID=3154281 RepID=UPI0033ADB7E5
MDERIGPRGHRKRRIRPADDVLAVEPAAVAETEERGLHRLFAALTRAVGCPYPTATLAPGGGRRPRS